MSREEIMRELAEQQQTLMRETYGFDNGVAHERERIIKLLKPLGCPENGVEHDCQDALGYTTAADLIALIKGNQDD